MDEIRLTEKYLQLACKDLGIEQEELELAKSPDPYNIVHTYLTRCILYLLNHDFNALLNSFYRMDLDEHRVRQLLSETAPDQLAGELARLVITREREKVITRLKYSQ